jgi:orotidine-5'-phosphate decarboxylase
MPCVFSLAVPEPARSPASTVAFGDALAARVSERESQIVLGLDPDPMALWPGIAANGEGARLDDLTTDDLPARGSRDDKPARGSHESRRQLVAHAVSRQCAALIDAAGPACVAVKPQLARFEVLGTPGWAALEEVVAYAHAAGLLVIADGKRGDIDVSAQAYARAQMGTVDTPLGAVPGLDADMVTVNPLMGGDAIEPFIATAREAGTGVLALVRTSNPGAADVEDLELAGGGRVWEKLAALVNRLGREGVGESGLSDVGAVVGATVPEHLARARELMPRAVFLLPGVGVQGGRVEELAPAFAPGRAGGLIAASRSIAGAHLTAGGDPPIAARAEAERLRELAWRLS